MQDREVVFVQTLRDVEAYLRFEAERLPLTRQPHVRFNTSLCLAMGFTVPICYLCFMDPMNALLAMPLPTIGGADGLILYP